MKYSLYNQVSQYQSIKLMNQYDNIVDILVFEGKRNCALTIVFPPDHNFKKQMDSLTKRIQIMKNVTKRSQILRVLKSINQENRDVETFGGNGLIVCGGLGKKNSTEYFNMVPPVKIKEFEYYYDYSFNIERIQEIMTGDVVIVAKPIEHQYLLDAVERDITQQCSIIVLGAEIKQALGMGLLDCMYFLGVPFLNSQLIETCRKYNTKILKFNDDDEKTVEMRNKFGAIIGYLKFPVDLTFQDIVEYMSDETEDE